MKTRTGKIARLPKPIRDQLNQRLENGESGTSLVQWLNQLPEVRKIITEQFARRPIRPQNLSEWRQGGYLDWQRHQLLREQTRVAGEQSAELGLDTSGNSISIAEDIAVIMSAELAIHVHSLAAIKDPKKHFRQFRLLSRELSRLRRDDQRAIRTQLLRQQSQSTPESTEEEKVLSEPKCEIPPPTDEAGVLASRAPLETNSNKTAEVAANTNPQPSSLLPSSGGPSPSATTVPTSPISSFCIVPSALPDPNSLTLKLPNSQTPPPTVPTSPVSSFCIPPSALPDPNSLTLKLPNSQTPPPTVPTSPVSSFCIVPSALPDPNSSTLKLPNSQTPPPNPAKSGYKISGIPIRGRRFVCIEG